MVACVLGALDSHDWSTHDSSLGAVSSLLEVFGCPPHDGSFLEVFGLEVDVFGLDVHELSTHPDAPLPPFDEGPPFPFELPAYADWL